MGALSKTGVCRPFDVGRDGFVLSEGAAVLVIEEREAALRRGRRILGEILGYGNAVDGVHPTVPDSAGQVRAMCAALAEGDMPPESVDHVSAHATGTRIGDEVERDALRHVFGPRGVPVSAVKGATGHLLGASGALEAAFAFLGIADGVVPGTVGLEEAVWGVNVEREVRRSDVRMTLCNSFGFGGVNASLLVRAGQE
jgi:3-oxoacyl-[acyl-carrier-protein] synthase II